MKPSHTSQEEGCGFESSGWLAMWVFLCPHRTMSVSLSYSCDTDDLFRSSFSDNNWIDQVLNIVAQFDNKERKPHSDILTESFSLPPKASRVSQEGHEINTSHCLLRNLTVKLVLKNELCL